jgi:D-alanine-D-alanine ligase
MLGIPYSGSDPQALCVTLDKDCAKRLVASAGVGTPKWVLVNERAAPHRDALRALGLPCIVKPAFEGSSKGILGDSVVDDAAKLEARIDRCLDTYCQPVLVEEFIEGEELTVGVVGNRPPQVLGIMHVQPRDGRQRFVYGLEVKRDWQAQVAYQCPPALPREHLAATERAALQAFAVLGCRDVARIDFRLRNGVPYFLEANPLPGLSPESGDLVLIARAMGVEHQALVERILQAAIDRIERGAA